MKKSNYKKIMIFIVFLAAISPNLIFAQNSGNVVQEPKRPFPYKEEEVSFVNPQAGITLAGTLTIPEGAGPFPGVLLISGSSPNTRDEPEPGGHYTFLVLSDYLTRHGIAALRYDKRGVGGSTGSFPLATTADFADDALAGFNYLRNRKEVNPNKVGLIGHSEGGYVAPLVASRSKKVDFIVSMAGPALDGKSQYRLQLSRIWKAEGYSDGYISKGEKLEDRFFEALERSENTDEAKQKIHSVIEDGLADLKKSYPKEFKESFMGIWFNEGPFYTGNWWRFSLKFNPEPSLKEVTCPVLALYGEKDLWEPPDVHIPALEKILKEGKNPEFTPKTFPGLNHLFQTCKTGLGEEYAEIPETIAPQVMEFMTTWIEKHTK